MRIINPAFGQQPASTETVVQRAVDWRKDPIVLFSNSKPNARELLTGLRDKLGQLRPVEGIDFIYKPSASQPATNAMLDDVAKRYRAALLALGD